MSTSGDDLAAEVETTTAPDRLVETHADLVVLSHRIWESAPDQFRGDVLARWKGDPIQVRVLVDAPRRARLRGLLDCADLAVGERFAAFELSAQLRALWRRRRVERDRSPLTGLPGNWCLREHMRQRLAEGEAVGVLLLDIDDFKAYNDRHGHLRGDAAILRLAEVARAVEQQVADTFATHVGGDDFAIVTDPSALDRVAARCLEGVREMQAHEGAFPPDLSVTLAGAVVAAEGAEELEEVFARLAQLKSRGKGRPGSNYVRDDA